MDGRLGRLQVQRDHAGDGLRSEAGLGERRHDERLELLGRGVALAADAQGECLRVVGEVVRGRLTRFVGDLDGQAGIVGEGQPAGCEPAREAARIDEAAGRTFEQGRHEGLGAVGMGEAKARWRGVEGDAEAAVAGGGDDSLGTDRCGQAFGERIGAAMPAQQRHDEAPGLVDDQHRRLLPLVGEERGQQANDDARGGDGDDRPAFPKSGGEVGRGRALDLATVGGGGQPFGERRRARAQMPDDWLQDGVPGPARTRAK